MSAGHGHAKPAAGHGEAHQGTESHGWIHHRKHMPTTGAGVFFGDYRHAAKGILHDRGKREEHFFHLAGLVFNPFAALNLMLNSRKIARRNREIIAHFEKQGPPEVQEYRNQVERMKGIFEHPDLGQILDTSGNFEQELKHALRDASVMEGMVSERRITGEQKEKLEKLMPEDARREVIQFCSDRQSLHNQRRAVDAWEQHLQKKLRNREPIEEDERERFATLLKEFYDAQAKFLSHFGYPNDGRLIQGLGVLRDKAAYAKISKALMDASKN